MARLREGEKEQNAKHIHRIVRGREHGLTEQELADLTGMQRRRLNNYLRELKEEEQLYRDGQVWYAELRRRLK
jgi:hypothetical protein